MNSEKKIASLTDNEKVYVRCSICPECNFLMSTAEWYRKDGSGGGIAKCYECNVIYQGDNVDLEL